MGELSARAAQLAREASRARIDADASTAARIAENEAMRALSRERAGEFISSMLRHNVPTIPIYQRDITRGKHGILHVIQVPDQVHGYLHKGDGWVLRQRRYSYEDGIVPGLFLTDKGDTYLCNEVTDKRPSDPPHLTQDMRRGEYVLTDSPHYRNEEIAAPGPWEPYGMLFSHDAGLDILANALVHYEAAD